ncbi:MAG: hypothetical protein HY331_06470 [Chloroflexi bacterium]|nr:hypothetical protein [Chloroflexota bacterium]
METGRHSIEIELPGHVRKAFETALSRLVDCNVRFVVAGAFAFHHYTGVWRFTKDLDVSVEPVHLRQALACLAAAGFDTYVEAASWLGKAFLGEAMVDVLFGEGNWLRAVGPSWFERSRPAQVLGIPVRVAPLEEMITSKAYVGGHERFDNADVCHLIVSRAEEIDWRYLIDRFGDHWQVLFAHLSLFQFVYPSERHKVPPWVMEELAGKTVALQQEPAPCERVCRGPLLDRFSYLPDVLWRGYVDARDAYAEARGFPGRSLADEREWALNIFRGNPPPPATRGEAA